MKVKTIYQVRYLFGTDGLSATADSRKTKKGAISLCRRLAEEDKSRCYYVKQIVSSIIFKTKSV